MGACVSSASSAAAPAVAFDWSGAPPRKTIQTAIPAAKKDVAKIIRKNHCAPIVVRTLFHDAGEYNKVRAIGGLGGRSAREGRERRGSLSRSMASKHSKRLLNFFFQQQQKLLVFSTSLFSFVRSPARSSRLPPPRAFVFTNKNKTKTKKQNVAAFPERGGANGSIRFKNESAHGANKGLDVALTLLAPAAAKHVDVSFADLIALAGATAVEVAGGPKIPMRYGRKDAPGPDSKTPEGNLPSGGAPWPNKAAGPAEHLREIFYRMGFDDREIVALSGVHNLGRAKPSRSGFGKESTKYTAKGPGTPGGSSWTKNWLTWDNEYFKNLLSAEKDPELLELETDSVLVKDPAFRPFAVKYAEDPKAFDTDYAAAHAKLSELGVEWEE